MLKEKLKSYADKMGYKDKRADNKSARLNNEEE